MSDNAEIAKTFLSHNSRDKPAVEVIQGLLERGDLQRADRPIPCWFDKDDLRSQGTWMSQLEDAVANCGAAVVFFGPDGQGPVHKYEIDLLLKRAMYEQGRDAIRLVLVLLPGAQENAIQGFISLHMWADFRKGLDDAAALQRLRAYILGEAPKSGPGDDPKVPKPEIEPYRGLVDGPLADAVRRAIAFAFGKYTKQPDGSFADKSTGGLYTKQSFDYDGLN